MVHAIKVRCGYGGLLISRTFLGYVIKINFDWLINILIGLDLATTTGSMVSLQLPEHRVGPALEPTMISTSFGLCFDDVMWQLLTASRNGCQASDLGDRGENGVLEPVQAVGKLRSAKLDLERTCGFSPRLWNGLCFRLCLCLVLRATELRQEKLTLAFAHPAKRQWAPGHSCLREKLFDRAERGTWSRMEPWDK